MRVRGRGKEHHRKEKLMMLDVLSIDGRELILIKNVFLRLVLNEAREGLFLIFIGLFYYLVCSKSMDPGFYIILSKYISMRVSVYSGIATGGCKGGRVPPRDSEKSAKIGKKREEIRKKEEKSGRKGKNREGSLTKM